MKCAMSALHDALESYIAIRRGLGAQMNGLEARRRRLVEFLDREGVTVVTNELVLRKTGEWCRS